MAQTTRKNADAASKALAWLKRGGFRHIRFELPDMHGTARSKQVPIEQFAGFARRGVNMYGGVVTLDTASHVIGGTRYNEEVKYRDQMLIPDFSSLAPVPWLPETAKVVCDTQWGPGDPLKAAPRYLVGQLLDAYKALGFDIAMSHEFEFYVFDQETHKPLFDGMHIFNNLRNEHLPVIREVVDYMLEAGIPMLTANAEYAPSQFELVYSHELGMKGADNAFTFKNGVKEIVQQAGYCATFMSKPFDDAAGSGCHYHLSLIDRKTGKNAFVGAKGAMTPTLRGFVQGLMDHGFAAMALFNPTPNCYRRLTPHTFAPSNVSWGEDDRSAMVRIKSPGTDAMHVEMRGASAISNPYLTIAGTLACGLLGLREKHALVDQTAGPSEEDLSLPPFPAALGPALDALNADRALCEILGEEFVSIFTTIKRYELGRFHGHVTEWERNEYIELH